MKSCVSTEENFNTCIFIILFIFNYLTRDKLNNIFRYENQIYIYVPPKYILKHSLKLNIKPDTKYISIH